MAYTPTPPTVDPSQKGPVLSGANDVPYVGKPKPGIPPTMPPGGTNRPPQKPRYGSSDGSGFDFQAYLAGKHRPRPVQVLPGQGMGPMPVGTKPLPKPTVSGGRNDGYGWAQGQTVGAKPFWTGPPGTEPAPIDWGNAGAFRDPSTDPRNPEFRNFRHDVVGRLYMPGDPRAPQGGSLLNPMEEFKGGLNQGGQLKPGGMGMRPPGFDGRGVDAGFSGGMQGMKGPAGQGGEQIGAVVNVGGPKPQFQGGQSVAPGMGMPTQYGGPTQARDFNVPNYGAPVQRGPMQGPPQVGTGPGSMGKPQQPGGMPSRDGGASHRGQRPTQSPVNPQALQQGAQALYGDNTIPHEFKGQLLQAAQSGDAQAFNDMLFNSGIPHETKLRLQQMFGYGSGAPTQAATPDQGVQQAGPPGGFDPRMGSGYYGAF